MPLEQIADDVWQITGFPRHAINAYLVGDVLVDAGIRQWSRWLPQALADRPLSLVVLTHCHPDHQGAAHAICRARNVPLACHALDRLAMEGRAPFAPGGRMIGLSARMWAGPPHAVARALHEGDEIAGFRCLHAPGHTPGHLALYRAADGLAIVGDVLNGMNLLTTWPGLHEPPAIFTADVEANRQSILRLAALAPRVVCFGHGPPLRQPERLQRFAQRLRPVLAVSAAPA